MHGECGQVAAPRCRQLRRHPPWTGAHERWLHDQRCDAPAVQLAFDSSVEAMLLTSDRRDRPGLMIEEMAADSEFTDVGNGCAACAGSPP